MVTVVYSIALLDLFTYKRYSSFAILTKTSRSGVLALLLMATIAYFDWTFRLPRLLLVLLFLVNTFFLILWHMAIRPEREQNQRAILLGHLGRNKQLKEYIQKEFHLIGVLSDKSFKDETLPYLGRIKDLPKVMVSHNVGMVIISLDPKERDVIMDILLRCQQSEVTVKAVPTLYDYVLTRSSPFSHLIDLSLRPIPTLHQLAKRCFDLLFSCIGILFSLPFLMIIPIMIKLDSEGPILYRQRRAAQFNRPFYIYKFRTMVTGAEKKTGVMISDNEQDPRITRLGRILRKTHLDEIPQLFLILFGQMSVVGPRPERPALNEKFEKEINGWTRRVYVKPGLTGLAQINDVTGLTPAEKIKYDLYYINHQSFMLDLEIVFIQILKLLR